MPTYAEKRVFPYSQEQLFQLVADIGHYPDFLPWCRSLRITRREKNLIAADVSIGFKIYRERFACEVVLDRPNAIEVSYLKGPMQRLNNYWKFIPDSDGGCIVDFYVDFELRSPLMRHIISLLFNEAIHRMINAFENRARTLYGNRNIT